MTEPVPVAPFDTCVIPGCIEIADIYDGPDGLCFDHFEQLAERWEAFAIAPAMRDLLPGLADR